MKCITGMCLVAVKSINTHCMVINLINIGSKRIEMPSNVPYVAVTSLSICICP